MTDLYTFVVDKIYSHVQGTKIKRGRSLNFRCPVCGDSKRNTSKRRGWLTINSKNQMPSYHCWNCDVRMGAYQFAAWLEGCDVSQVKKQFWAENKDSTQDLMAAITNQPLSTITLDDPEVIQDAPVSTSIDYGDDWVDYTDNEYAKAIIVNRKILEAPFIPHDWKFFYDSKTNRLVIPWIRDGEMVYYQSRAIIKSPEKYLFPKNTEKDVFGLDTFDESVSSVFICEGVFDAIWTINCLAIGGLKLSKHQEQIIQNRTQFSTQVYFPDNQWKDQSAMRASIEYAQAGGRVFIWPKEFKQKDVNDYVLKNKTNPFMDINFMSKHVYKGIAALTRLKFMR